MFYSHDILTERTYGIATIWLVATLGVSRTIQRKLGRKEILSVNLPKACDTVTNPKVPLALRLQSNLLVGISRVYKQQFEYLYYDVAHTHTNIRKLDCLTRDPRLNLARGGEGRPEQLVLQDDPCLAPDLLGVLDLADIGLGNLSLDDLQNGELVDLADSLDPHASSASQQHSLGGGAATSPTTSAAGGGVDRGFHPPSSVPGHGLQPMALGGPDGSVLELEEHPQFSFDGDGVMRDLSPDLPAPLPGRAGPETPTPVVRANAGAGRLRVPGSRLESEDILEQVRREHDEAGQPALDIFPQPMPVGLGTEPEVPVAQLPSSEPAEAEAAAAVTAAATRRLRGPRANRTTVDQTTSLTNSQLRAFSRDYLQNMATASKAIQARRELSAAKSFAEKLVLEHGIGGELLNPTLKALFSGEAILGIHRGDSGKKRKRAMSDGGGEGEDEKEDGDGEEDRGKAGEGVGKSGGGQDSARLTRARARQQEAGEDGQEVGRGMELGREAPPDLEQGDIASDLGGGAFLSPGGGISAQPTSSAAGSRFASPSPAQSREPRGVSRMSVAGSVQSVLSGVQEVDESALQHGLDDSTNEFDFFRGGERAKAQWLLDTNEEESNQFLEFLLEKLAEERTRKLAELEQNPELEWELEQQEQEPNLITFAGLIKPGQALRVVAARAFSKTLLLASKGLITVSQVGPYGSIQIGAH